MRNKHHQEMKSFAQKGQAQQYRNSHIEFALKKEDVDGHEEVKERADLPKQQPIRKIHDCSANDKCHCGSDNKYKRCCRDRNANLGNYTQPIYKYAEKEEVKQEEVVSTNE